MVNLFSSNIGSNDFFNYFFLATRLQKAQALSGDFNDYFILPTHTPETHNSPLLNWPIYPNSSRFWVFFRKKE
jgi:hypothetical protein